MQSVLSLTCSLLFVIVTWTCGLFVPGLVEGRVLWPNGSMLMMMRLLLFRSEEALQYIGDGNGR